MDPRLAYILFDLNLISDKQSVHASTKAVHYLVYDERSTCPMARKISMCEFVFGRCRSAKEPEWFAGIWLKTKGNPCLNCSDDLTNCRFYRVLLGREVLIGEGNPLKTS
jgi:hypothetical protein